MGKEKKSEKPVGVLREISFNVNITIFLLILIIVVTLSILFCSFPNWREELSFIAAAIGGGAVVYGGYYTSLSFKMRLIEEKKHRSFEAVKDFFGYDFTKVRTFLDVEIETKNLSQLELYNKIANDKEISAMTKALLNHLEILSESIQEKYVNEYIIYWNFCSLVPFLYDGFLPYIKELRKIKDDRTLYIELDKLANAWKSGKYLSTGEKLPDLI